MNSALITQTSEPQCPSSLIFWQDDPTFNSAPFNPSGMVKWFHERWFRFGRTNDILLFIMDDASDDETDDGGYLTGLFATTIITGLALIMWMSLILVYSKHRRLKLPNQKKQQDIYRKIGQTEVLLGYEQDEDENKYFGRPFCKPLPPPEPQIPEQQNDATSNNTTGSSSSMSTEEKKELDARKRDYNRDFRRYQSDMLDWKSERAIYKRRVNCTRITVVVGCLVVIICSTLFYISGAKLLLKVAKDSKVTLQKVQIDTQQEMDRIQGFLEYSQASNITQILDFTNSYCPLVRPRICTNLLTASGCDWSGIPYGTLVQKWVATLVHYQTEVSLVMYDLQQDLKSSYTEVDDWMSSLDKMEFGLTMSTIFVFVLDALCLYILIGVTIAWTKQRKVPQFFVWIRSYCLIPLFVLVVVVCWMFSSTFVLASLTTSDFCHNGPTEKVVALVQQAGVSQSFTDLIRHYVTSCSNVFVPDVFSSDIDQLVQSVRDAKMLQSNLIIFANGEMRDTCGPFAESVLSGTASMAEGELCQAASMLHESRTNVACSAWNPIFTSMAQDMLCKDAMDAFAWITFSQLVIVFVSMVILTFRVAILPVKYVRWQPRAKALSRRVTADLKKMSGLAQAISEERLKTTKLEPVYHLGYSSSSNGTAESVSDYAEVSTTEPSYSDSNSLQTNTPRIPQIAPKMVDEDSFGSPKKAESNMTLLASNKDQAAPIITQTVFEMEEYEFDVEEEKPISESLLSEAIPPSQQSTISATASSAALESSQEEENKPESYSLHSVSETIPASLRSMTSRTPSMDSSVEDAKPESAIRVLMAKGASVRHKSQTDESSFEEETIRSDSDFEEATYCSVVSSHAITSDSDAEGSRRSHSDRKATMSLHSRRSDRYLTSLEDVAEESPSGNGISSKPGPEVRRFAAGNAFMDHLLVEKKTPAKPPPKPLSLEIGKFSSLGGSMADTTSRSFGVDAVEGASTNEQSKPLTDSGGCRVDDEIGQGPPRNPERKDETRRSSRSLRNLEEVNAAGQKKDGDESFHFSLHLDMDTYHSADFGDFSSSGGSNDDTFAAAEYEIIEEVILPDQVSERNLRRSTSISALSVDPDDPAYKSFNTDEAYKSLDARLSGHSQGIANGVDKKAVEKHNQFQKALMRDTGAMQAEAEKESLDEIRNIESSAAEHNDEGTGDITAAKNYIDFGALKQRINSIRSLGSSSAGMPRNQTRASFDSAKRGASIRSIASGHSIAISAATANEMQYRLDDDMDDGSGDSFGYTNLPSRAIDSEMLAVVDETWTEDLRDKEVPSSVAAKVQMKNLVNTLRPKQHSWRADTLRSHGSDRSNQQRIKPWRADSVMLQNEGEASMRSLTSTLSGEFRRSSGSINLADEFEVKKPPSNRSLASTPSIAISAATLNETQFYLDDDNGGSSDSFGHAMLPSRAIDSEMLAVVDETWTEDVQDQEVPSSQQAKAHMRNLAKNSQPQPLHRHQPQQIFLHKGAESVRSLGMDSFSASMSASLSASLSDDFDNSFNKPKKPISGRSLGASSPSIAISAATLDEKQFFLGDNMGGSGSSFGDAMLPSRALDSEMLAIVDETWAESEQESPSSPHGKVQLEILAELEGTSAPMTE